jgi:hypothetical protein
MIRSSGASVNEESRDTAGAVSSVVAADLERGG